MYCIVLNRFYENKKCMSCTRCTTQIITACGFLRKAPEREPPSLPYPSPTPDRHTCPMSSAAANVATTSSLPPTILVGADYHDTTTTTTSRGNMTTAVAAGATSSSSSAITTTTATTTSTTHQLQQRLSSLKAQSTNLSSELTRRLATSRSGQSLLHIGPSLSTLPPDLSSLADAITPFLDDVANYEAGNVEECERLTAQYRTIDTLLIRTKYARECSTLYDELIVAERIVIADVEQRMKEVTLHAAAAAGGGGGGGGSKTGKKKKDEKKVEEDDSDDEDEDDDNDGLDEGKENMWTIGQGVISSFISIYYTHVFFSLNLCTFSPLSILYTRFGPCIIIGTCCIHYITFTKGVTS